MEALRYMKNLYNIVLAAGSRVGGAPQFGSQAEHAFYEETCNWLESEFSEAISRKHVALGLYSVYLTEEQAESLMSDSRFIAVELSMRTEPVYVQSNVDWNLAAVCNRTDFKYEYKQTGRGVKIYIVDSGVEAMHTEFEDRVIKGYDSEAGAAITHPHGTMVAGMAAGRSVGVAKLATIVDVRVGNIDPTSSTFAEEDVIAGLDWIVSSRAAANDSSPAVVNCSFGYYASAVSGALGVALSALIADGLIVIGAAGNGNPPGTGTELINTNKFFPACYTGVICVGAIQEDLYVAPFSNYGAEVDIFAPGRFVMSSTTGGSLAEGSGTSLAAPVVAGAAACAVEGLEDVNADDFYWIMRRQRQINKIPVAGAKPNTTRDVIFSNMVRTWHGNTGSVGDLKPFKKYVLKPFTETTDTRVVTYLPADDKHITIVGSKGSVVKLGCNMEERFSISTRVVKIVSEPNPEV